MDARTTVLGHLWKWGKQYQNSVVMLVHALSIANLGRQNQLCQQEDFNMQEVNRRHSSAAQYMHKTKCKWNRV